MKKLVTVLLALAVSLSAVFGLTACGRSENYDPNNFLPNGTAENPYQIVAEPITIKIFVPKSALNPSFKNLKMFQKLEEMTNLRFIFTEADTAAYSQLRSAAWEDKKSLPDLFLFNNPVSEQVIYSQYGAVVPFNDSDLVVNGIEVGSLIDNYMPTYKKLLDENFNIDSPYSARKVATFSDGMMYSTLCVNDVPRDLTFKMYINQQWIENLREDDVEIPSNVTSFKTAAEIPDATDIKTVEEYVDILRLFKKYDVNRNGDPNDEVPVSAKELEYLRNFILASYGYVYGGAEQESDGSKMTYVPSTEAYRKYLQTMNIMFSEGLLDKSTFSIKTDAQLAQKGLEHRLGSFCSAAAYITVGYDYEDEYEMFGPLTSDYYTGDPIQWGFANFSPTGAVIPTGTSKVREVARLLDIMYSDIGCQLIAYGEEGVDWKWDNEDKTSWTFLVPDDWTGSQEDYRATITPNVGTASALYWKYDFVGKMNDDIITALNRMSERYAPYLKQIVPDDLKMIEEEYNKIETINASLDVYLKNAECLFVMGDNDPFKDSDWNSFQSDLKSYRSEELIRCYNDAFARNKK